MYEQTKRIRELINKPITQCTLLKNRALWYQLCSCLDVIGDTDLAIASYLNGEYRKSTGAEYLAKYGLLQALNIQQDAVFHLCESLKMPNPRDNYPRLKEVKDIRIKSIGHPTKRKKGQLTSYHFISRITLTPDGFELLSFDSNGELRAEDIPVPNLIEDQKICLSEILTSVIGELEQREKAHKEKFRMEKLTSFFPDTLGYAFEKVFEGTITTKNDPRGKIGLHEIRQAVQRFREALEKRGVTYDSISYVCELLDYPLAELEAFFQNVQNGRELNINERTAYIFAFFVKEQVNELKVLAQEIDEDYSS
jgi:hypothetical protein